MSKAKKVKGEIGKLIVSYLSVACPAIPAVKDTVEFKSNLSNIILLDKLNRVLRVQSDDFDDWLKMKNDFQIESSKYNNTVKRLVYLIDSITEERKLDIYANLLKTYKSDRITEEMFWRLTHILGSVYYGDLLYLQEKVNFDINEAEENIQIDSLLNFKLLYIRNKGSWNMFEGSSIYAVSKLGFEMVRCGIDYDNYENYKERPIEQISR